MSTPQKSQAISDKRLYRMGVVGGAVGSVVAFPFVALHPHLPPGDATGVLQTVLDFGPWLFLHFGLMMVLLLILAGLAAFSRSIRDDRASAWATAAFVVGLVGTVFAILGQGVDGLGLYVIAHVWQATPPDQQFAAVITGAGVMGVATGVFILVLFFYFGFTSLVYGVALWLSDEFPKWLAAIALWGGILGLTSALLTYFDDFSDPVYFGLFIPSAVVFLIWVFLASVILYRRELAGVGRHLGNASNGASNDGASNDGASNDGASNDGAVLTDAASNGARKKPRRSRRPTSQTSEPDDPGGQPPPE